MGEVGPSITGVWKPKETIKGALVFTPLSCQLHTEGLAGGDVGIVSEDSDSGSVESVDRESCLQLYLYWLEGVSDDHLKNIFLEKVFFL